MFIHRLRLVPLWVLAVSVAGLSQEESAAERKGPWSRVGTSEDGFLIICAHVRADEHGQPNNCPKLASVDEAQAVARSIGANGVNWNLGTSRACFKNCTGPLRVKALELDGWNESEAYFFDADFCNSPEDPCSEDELTSEPSHADIIDASTALNQGEEPEPTAEGECDAPCDAAILQLDAASIMGISLPDQPSEGFLQELLVAAGSTLEGYVGKSQKPIERQQLGSPEESAGHPALIDPIQPVPASDVSALFDYGEASVVFSGHNGSHDSALNPSQPLNTTDMLAVICAHYCIRGRGTLPNFTIVDVESQEDASVVMRDPSRGSDGDSVEVIIYTMSGELAPLEYALPEPALQLDAAEVVQPFPATPLEGTKETESEESDYSIAPLALDPNDEDQDHAGPWSFIGLFVILSLWIVALVTLVLWWAFHKTKKQEEKNDGTPTAELAFLDCSLEATTTTTTREMEETGTVSAVWMHGSESPFVRESPTGGWFVETCFNTTIGFQTAEVPDAPNGVPETFQTNEAPSRAPGMVEIIAGPEHVQRAVDIFVAPNDVHEMVPTGEAPPSDSRETGDAAAPSDLSQETPVVQEAWTTGDCVEVTVETSEARDRAQDAVVDESPVESLTESPNQTREMARATSARGSDAKVDAKVDGGEGSSSGRKQGESGDGSSRDRKGFDSGDGSGSLPSVGSLGHMMLGNGSKVELQTSLGKGRFGAVYQGLWNDVAVAVKVINMEVSSSSLASIVREQKLSISLRHPNIIQTFFTHFGQLDSDMARLLPGNGSSAAETNRSDPDRSSHPMSMSHWTFPQSEGMGLSSDTSPGFPVAASCSGMSMSLSLMGETAVSSIPLDMDSAMIRAQGAEHSVIHSANATVAGLSDVAGDPAGLSVSRSEAASADAHLAPLRFGSGANPGAQASAWAPGSASDASSESKTLVQGVIMLEQAEGDLHGALQQGLLREAGEGGPELASILRVLTDAANGMAYLHQNGIAHLDLKTKNIFYMYSYRKAPSREATVKLLAKIGDFGLAMKADQPLEGGQVRGTVTHLAPEVFRGDLSLAADAYSFGVVMWELFVQRPPYHELQRTCEGMDDFQKKVMDWVVTKDKRLEFPPNCPPAYVELAGRCFARDPQARPTFPEIVTVLKAISADVNDIHDSFR